MLPNTASCSNTFEISLCMQETLVCGSAISHVSAECLNSSCSTTNETMNMLSNGKRRVMATFTDLIGEQEVHSNIEYRL